MQVVAVDVSGDGVADTSFGPLECEPWCSAFAAPDVDGDGTDELLIQNIQFTIAGLRLYDVRSDPQRNGGARDGRVAGIPGRGPRARCGAQFWIGGDAFDSDTLRCFEGESPPAGPGRVLIQTSATQVPPDSPDARWHATETWFDLQPDGTVTIVDRGDFEEAIGSGPPSFAQLNDLCGARLPRPFGGCSFRRQGEDELVQDEHAAFGGDQRAVLVQEQSALDERRRLLGLDQTSARPSRIRSRRNTSSR